MFSVRSFTSAAMRAISATASSRKHEPHALGLEQRGVLAGEGVLRLGQDAHEVVLGEGVELDADREAALELRDQVGRLRDVERARTR